MSILKNMFLTRTLVLVSYSVDLFSPSICYCCLVAKSCQTLCDPVDCSLPGSSVHEIPQIRTLEWVAISFSTGSSWPRGWNCVSYIGRQILSTEPPGKFHLWLCVCITLNHRSSFNNWKSLFPVWFLIHRTFKKKNTLNKQNYCNSTLLTIFSLWWYYTVP